MATLPWSTFYEDVLPYVNGCPPNIATQKIREAAIKFFKDSRAWRYLALTAIDAVALQQRYPITSDAAKGSVPVNAVVAHVFEVKWLGEGLDVLTLEQFKQLSDTWYSDSGDPDAATMFAESEVALYPIPEAGTAAAILLPDVALAPSQASTGLDDSLYERWRTPIALGARALIHQIPKKPYSDVQLGMSLMQDFNAAAGGANARTASGRSMARLRTRTIYR